jgi:hypothetical protein
MNNEELKIVKQLDDGRLYADPLIIEEMFRYTDMRIGVGKVFTLPLPPNRTCGFPAYGSPVDSFFIEIGTLKPKLHD